jgi:hypothetical protein
MRGLKDDAAGRRAYLKHLEERVRQEGEKAGRGLPEGQSLQSTLQRGWMFGSEAFKEKGAQAGGQGAGSELGTQELRGAVAVGSRV